MGILSFSLSLSLSLSLSVYIYIYVEMIDFGEPDNMIKLRGKLDK